MWGHYIFRTNYQDAFYVALDCAEEHRPYMLQKLVAWCNGETNWDELYKRVDNWPKIGESDRDRTKEVPEHMIKPLEFAHDWYEHYTQYWGPYVRNAEHLLGEGN